MLDGVTFPTDEHAVVFQVYDKVVCDPPAAPKGGYLLGTDLALRADGLPTCEFATVRIRGLSGTPIEVSGTVSENLDSVTVHLPGKAQYVGDIGVDLFFICLLHIL